MNKLNKKGFTLVELLTTITILGILMAVAGGAVLIYLERSRTQAIETIASTSYDGSVMYLMDRNILLNSGEFIEVSIADLYEGDYIDRPSDPYNSVAMCEGTVKVTNETTSITTGLEDYKYEVHVECSSDHTLDQTYPKE